ncbi:RNA polymerase sigma factor [Mumia quercus]|uniref:RNA polymerase sigma factor n=1 Tax=Mumia quercus TaxID=2976125 RepID=UPI0021D182EB|nr:sigma-70 family RNA polymerase sigma factor [Mumia quercus]
MTEARAAVEAVWRIEAGRLVAGLARVTGDVGLAEELAQDALVVALEQWPSTGIPPNPAGWLMTTAKNRAIDGARRRATYQRKLEQIGRDTETETRPSDEIEDALDDDIGDDLLRLVFTACHPLLSVESRVALTLRCVGGLSTTEIARGFLIPEKTAGQRISRAKKTLADRGVVFAMPDASERAARLRSVMEVVYLIFNEGYAAQAGEDWTRPALCQEALRLARLLATLVPEDPEVHGFVALLELQASRIPARTTADGQPVLLLDQDRRRWDRTLLRRGLEALARAEEIASAPGPEGRGPALGPYAIQAEIAACHVRAATPGDTDWGRIAALYVLLRHAWPSPVVELNRAVAVGFAEGPEHGLAVVDAVSAAPALASYPQLPAVRADLLARLGRTSEAREAYERAAALSANARERAVYVAKAAELG